MTALLFEFPKATSLGKNLRKLTGALEGKYSSRTFPDGETYVRVESDVKDQVVIINASLANPNDWFLGLLFLADALLKLGAQKIILVAPYLSYMRQDKAFHTGEAVTSETFAQLISTYFDKLITVDPHLHRYKSLKEIYTIPSTVLHATDLMAQWIQKYVPNPFIIGPDMESLQWVKEVAGNFPYVILDKVRHGDQQVEITWPELTHVLDKTPVLVDDIISSGVTMIQALEHLKAHKFKDAICMTVHPIFAGASYQAIQALGVLKIISTNSIEHPSNQLNLAPLLAEALKSI